MFKILSFHCERNFNNLVNNVYRVSQHGLFYKKACSFNFHLCKIICDRNKFRCSGMNAIKCRVFSSFENRVISIVVWLIIIILLYPNKANFLYGITTFYCFGNIMVTNSMGQGLRFSRLLNHFFRDLNGVLDII